MDASNSYVICESRNSLGLVEVKLNLFSLIALIQTAVNKDIASFKYATTIGPNQFCELTLNCVLNPIVECKGGHPGKVYLVLMSAICVH